MNAFRHLKKSEQPREKLCNLGPAALSEGELLAIVLGHGIRGRDVISLVDEIIRTLEDCQNTVTLDVLMAIKGVGPARACQILSAIEFSKRFLSFRRPIEVNSPEDVIPLLGFLKYTNQEEFCIVTLDGANQVIRVHRLTRGLVNQSQIHPREILAAALEDRAVGILLAHNHPSGVLKPSKTDLNTTRGLFEAASIMGIPIIDHIIIGPKGMVSLKRDYSGLFI